MSLISSKMFHFEIRITRNKRSGRGTCALCIPVNGPVLVYVILAAVCRLGHVKK